jgi:hypothetical protein
MNTNDPKGPIGPLKRPVVTPECLTQPRFRAAVESGFTAAEARHVRKCPWCSRVLATFPIGSVPGWVWASAAAAGQRYREESAPAGEVVPDWIKKLLKRAAEPDEVHPRAWAELMLEKAAWRAEPKDYAVFDHIVMRSMTISEAAALEGVSLVEALESLQIVLVTVSEEARATGPTVREEARNDPLGFGSLDIVQCVGAAY